MLDKRRRKNFPPEGEWCRIGAPDAREPATIPQRGNGVPSSSLTAARSPLPSRQLLLEFPPDWGETPVPEDHVASHPEGDRYALQNNHPRTPGAAPGDLQPA